MRIVVYLIFPDIVPDICRAVRLVEKGQILLILPVQIRYFKKRKARTRDGRHRAAALRDLLHLARCPVKAFAGLPEPSKADPQADCHDDHHHNKKAQIIDNIREVRVQRQPRDQAADRDCKKTDNNVGDFSHDCFPLFFDSDLPAHLRPTDKYTSHCQTFATLFL